jgi:hypothetical protein
MADHIEIEVVQQEIMEDKQEESLDEILKKREI